MIADLLMVKLLGTVIREFKLGLDDKMVSLLRHTKAITTENMNKLGKDVGLSEEELLQ